jgi:hypothetical protein
MDVIKPLVNVKVTSRHILQVKKSQVNLIEALVVWFLFILVKDEYNPTTQFSVNKRLGSFIQLGLNEANIPESSSILIY